MMREKCGPISGMRKEPRIERGTSVQSLSGALASFGKIAREAIGKSNELGDAVSADIFNVFTVEPLQRMIETVPQRPPARRKSGNACTLIFPKRFCKL